MRKHDMSRVNRPKIYNPYKNHRPHVIRFRGSVVKSALFPTLMVTAVSAAVTALYMKTNIKMSIPNTFTPVLGIVVGLLLTYRTNTAYD
ncbi:17671_t:CDS:1, partial [Acaulospora morrowiae]